MTSVTGAPRTSFMPPAGDTGTGAVTFKVVPSGAALALTRPGLSGEVGLWDCLEHATTRAKTQIPDPNQNLRFITVLSRKNGTLS